MNFLSHWKSTIAHSLGAQLLIVACTSSSVDTLITLSNSLFRWIDSKLATNLLSEAVGMNQVAQMDEMLGKVVSIDYFGDTWRVANLAFSTKIYCYADVVLVPLSSPFSHQRRARLPRCSDLVECIVQSWTEDVEIDTVHQIARCTSFDWGMSLNFDAGARLCGLFLHLFFSVRNASIVVVSERFRNKSWWLMASSCPGKYYPTTLTRLL